MLLRPLNTITLLASSRPQVTVCLQKSGDEGVATTSKRRGGASTAKPDASSRLTTCARAVAGIVLLAGAWLAGTAAQAENFTTNTINGTVVNTNGSYIVGETGVSNALEIINGGTLNDTNGYIGYNSSADFNTALVSDSGSLWRNTNDLYIGFQSADNQLVIAAGGTVQCNDGHLGETNGADNNSVLVTGGGSTWRTTNGLWVGSRGAGNQLTIADGGTVHCNDGHIGDLAGADNNSVLITGSGSVWKLAYLYVGSSDNVPGGVSNALVIVNGGSLNDTSAFLGAYPGANFNMALVSGIGSSWSNTGGLWVGYFGAGNQLTIADGGKVYSLGGSVGDFYDVFNEITVPDNNSVLVTGSGSVWDLNFGGNGTLYVGNYGSSNTLTITNGGHVADFNAYAGYDASSSNNVVVVTGSGSLWSITNLYLGFFGGHNQLTISDGGVVNCESLYVGSGGSDSCGNSVVISNGAAVNATYMEVGSSAGCDDRVTLADATLHADSLLIHPGGTLAGDGTVSGSVEVASGGTISPGNSIGIINLDSPPVLNGTLAMELNKNDQTNDVLNLTSGVFTYGGTLALTVTAGTLAGGEVFDLFEFSGISSGSFTNITTSPALAAGLNWWQGNLASAGTIVLNRKPVGGSHSVTTRTNVPLAISRNKLTAGDSDPDGNSLSISAIASSPLPSGATLSLDSTTITYTPTATAGADNFTYTLSDGRGGADTVTVTVTVTDSASGAVSANVVYGPTIDTAPDPDEFVVRFAGHPGESYTIEFSTGPTGPWTKKAPNRTAPTTDTGFGIGVFEFRETIGTSGFYRTVYPSY